MKLQEKFKLLEPTAFGPWLAASMPFIEKITTNVAECNTNYITKLSLLILALIGLIHAVTWASNLKHTIVSFLYQFFL